MKVLHIYKTYMPDSIGGVETAIQELTQGLHLYGINSEVLTVSTTTKNNINDNVKITRFKTSFNVASCPFSIEFMTRFQQCVTSADIIHYHFPWPFAEMVHLLNRVKKPSLVTYHSDIVRQRLLKPFYRPLMNAFLASTNCIVTTSKNYLDSSEDLKPFRDKCIVIPIGISDDTQQAENLKTNEWQHKIPDDFILYIGVTRYYKGLHLLIEAAEYTDVNIVIAGSGPLDQELRELVTQRKLNNVYFLGKISATDKAALLSLASAVILPSHLRSEAFGITLVEGLMHGKPLISTEIGTGTSYINQDKVTGLVVPGNNVKQLLKAINRLHYNKKLLHEYGTAARKRYIQNFTQEKYSERYANVYHRILAER